MSMFIQRSISTALCVLSGKFVFNDCLVTRHSLVRAKGEVLVLLYVVLFVRFFCHRFLDNPRADSCQSLHAGVLWFRMCLLPFWGLAALGGRKKWEMKFSSLWESMGNFCILAVFERFCRTYHVLSDITGRFVGPISLSDILGTSDILSRNSCCLYSIVGNSLSALLCLVGHFDLISIIYATIEKPLCNLVVLPCLRIIRIKFHHKSNLT